MKSPNKNDPEKNDPDNNNSQKNSANQAVLEFMSNRRSVPAKFMSGPGPDDEQLVAILKIASRAPDHGKLTPWRFIHYGPKKCAELGEIVLKRAHERASEKGRALNEEQIAIERHRFVRAPVVVAVVSSAAENEKIPQWEQILSSGAVAMNMLIGANAAGFDAQWLTEWCAYDEALREALGLKDGERITGFVHIGTRLNPKTPRGRPELEDIYTYVEK